MSHCMWALRALHGSVYFSSPGTMQKWRYQARAWNKQLNCQHQEKAEHVAEIFIIWQKKKTLNKLRGKTVWNLFLNRSCWIQSGSAGLSHFQYCASPIHSTIILVGGGQPSWPVWWSLWALQDLTAPVDFWTGSQHAQYKTSLGKQCGDPP